MKSSAFLVCVVFTQSGCIMGKSNAPQVNVDAGRLEGRREGSLNVFKGIPYAAAPIDRLRWRAPQPVPKWSGVRKAVRYGNDAPQKASGAPHQSEDCLFLNVWAPAKKESEPLPVMVWIHGGGFTQGSGRIRGEAFANKGVVFVSINYRLGRFGFFAHPSLDRERPAGEPPANFGIQDQIAALRWVQRNIAQFGGDPKRVTIFGVSAGGTSVNLLMASPLAKGLFQRAISQSGIGGFGPYRRWKTPHLGKEPMTAVGEAYAKARGITAPATAATQLRALPWKTVAEIGPTPADQANFETVVDGATLLDDPQRTFETGRQNRVPFIGGFNSFEGNLSLVIPWTDQPPREAVTKRLDRLAPLYSKKATDPSLWNNLYGDVYFGLSTILLVREMERVKTPSWTYYFDYVRNRGGNSQGAGHGSEVPYLFDQVMFAGESERRIIRDMQGHWIQFAKTGNPNGHGLPNWPAHKPNKPITMVYGQTQRKAESNWLRDRFSILFEALDETWPRE